MTKRVHTILCWILAISLVWLPFSVSADYSLSPTKNNTCHKMSSDMAGHGHAAVSDLSMHEPMVMPLSADKPMNLNGLCDQCDNDCTGCIGMTSCVHSSNHAPTIITFNKVLSQSLQLTQSSIGFSAQYHSQIITPDFRPPIV